mgnify:CR=1 FL=1
MTPRLFLYRPPALANWIYGNSVIWSLGESSGQIGLTFDDGPDPGITPLILETLEKYGVQATFFVIGAKALLYPELIAEIRQKGHAIGNHTHSHLNGWKTSSGFYKQDVEKCSQMVPSVLFRPPYGKITPQQIRLLKKKYRIVMWSLLSGDFRSDFDPESIFRNTVQRTRAGDIVVFHEHPHILQRMPGLLPRYIETILGKGYTFGTLSD